jgi:hypothetical protein
LYALHIADHIFALKSIKGYRIISVLYLSSDRIYRCREAWSRH